jgi:hypothetical protein
MIPKIIFQTSLLKQPKYVTDLIQSRCQGWKYYHFTDDEIVKFIIDNPIEEFKNSVDILKTIHTGAHRADFFRYYFLYVNGGIFLDSDAMIEQDIDLIVKFYSFFTVHSGMENNSIFNGFIGAEPKNEIIYHALKQMYIVDKNLLNSDYFFVCKNLKDIIQNVDSTKFIKKYKLFQEVIYSEKAVTNDENNKKILTHYYKNKIIKRTFENKILKSPDKTKIGITLELPPNVVELFSNGIKQNILYLNELFLNIGYDSYFIVNNLNQVEPNEVEKMMYDTRFKIVNRTDIFSFGFDIVIVMGYELQLSILKQLRYMKVKTIGYFCGNSYILDSERILYKHGEQNHPITSYDIKDDFILYDKIWSIPQMYNTNKYYWETLYRCECVEIPFIWSDKAIRLSESIGEQKNFMYKNRGDKKRLVILEPNISIMKSGMPPLLICENSYRKNKDLIDRVFLNNVYNIHGEIKLNLNALSNFVEQLDLHKDKKVSIEKRYNALFFLSNFADIVVSHQWENNLNYLYLELAWMGWAIVHNGSLCKDVGYYYEGFNYKEGSEQLDKVLLEHDKNASEYLEKNRKAIDKYLPTNTKLQEQYNLHIRSLF